MEAAQINAKSLLEIAARRKWALLLPFLFFLMLAGWLSVVLPRAYRGEATLLYQPRALPKEYVQQLTNYSTEDWLRSITQRITSRERMLAVAVEFGLFEGRTDAERAELMRRATSVELVEPELRKDNPYRTSREPSTVTAFTLSFEAPRPELASQATNRLAELLVAESRRSRTRQASAAGEFIKQELSAAAKRLRTQEARLEEFKQRYAGELPEQVQANATALATAQLRLQAVGQQKAAAKEKVLECRQRITELVHGVAALSSGGAMTSEVNPLLAQLQEKRQELEILRSRYTPEHPDVVQAKSELARLEAKLTGTGRVKAADAVDIVRANPLLKDVTAQLEAAEDEYRRLDAEEQAVQQAIVLYQRRIDLAPQRAQELESLNRDYLAMQSAYQALVNKELETEMAANLEGEAAGDQFTMLDTAVVPQKPSRPSFRKILVFCTLLGLVFGMVGATVFEFADDSFRNEADAEGFLKLPVLAAIPKLQTSVEVAEERRRRGKLVMIAAAVAAGYCLILVLLWSQGIHLKLPA